LLHFSSMGRNELLTHLATHTARGGYRMAYRVLRDREDARDAVQEALARACESVDSLRNPSHVEGWFYRVVMNLCRDALGRRRRFLDVPIPDAPAAGSTPMAADDALALSETLTGLTAHVEALPAMQRAAVALRYGDDRSLEDVAGALGVALGTAKSHLHRAHARLRAVLGASTVCGPVLSVP
jgi:RNA polymerase sigma-70 factor (ECF subfamily)